jgi:hypothetical protein
MEKTEFSQEIKNDISKLVGGIMDRLGLSVSIGDADLILKVNQAKDASAGVRVWPSGKVEIMLKIGNHEPMSTALHEWGHILAGLTARPSQLDKDYLFGKKLREWYNKNAVGRPKAGNSFGVAYGYGTVRELPINLPDWYSALSTGHELESTFFEYLFLNPAKLARYCPEFINLVLGMMK